MFSLVMAKKYRYGHKHKDKHAHKWKKYKPPHSHSVHHNAKMRKAFTELWKKNLMKK